MHNIIRRTRTPPQGNAPVGAQAQADDQQQLPGLEAVSLRPTAQPQAVRESFCHYVNNEMAVPWQNNMVG